MKILAHVHGYVGVHNAGAEMMLHHMLRHFVERGHECKVLTPPQMLKDGHNTSIEGVEVLGHWDAVQQRRWYSEADVVMSHLDLSPQASRWAKEAGRPMVHLIHNPTSLNVYPIEEYHVDLAIYNSYSLAMQSYRINPPASVLYPPVFDKDYRSAIDHSKNTYATLINLNENKGGSFLIQLAKLDNSLQYLAVRGCYDQQITSSSENLLLHPHTNDIQSVYAQTRVLLVPSHSETWGRVAIEAMWAGIPIVANSECVSPGFREALGDAVIWAPRSNPSVWVEALRSLEDPSVYDEWRRKGLDRADQLQQRTLFQLATLERQLASLVNHSVSNRVHFFAREVHYLKHISPVAHSIHPDNLGMVVTTQASGKDALLEGHMVLTLDESAAPNRLHYVASPSKAVAYTVGYLDHLKASELGYRVIRAEHGSGQTYMGVDTGSYAGSELHGSAFLCLYPGYHPFTEHRRRARRSKAYMVGAPILDRHIPRYPSDKSVGFAFHWNCEVLPETKETFSYWKDAVVEVTQRLRSQGYNVFIHHHPRLPADVSTVVEAGAIFIRDRDTFLANIHVLVADNTSLIYEAAAIDRVVVVLNHPGYRRHVEHGLRFWTASDVGIHCDTKDSLESSIKEAAARNLDDLEFRDSAVRYVYSGDRPTQRTLSYLYECLSIKTTPDNTVSVRVKKDFDSGAGRPFREGTILTMRKERALSFSSSGLVELLNEKDLRHVHVSKPDKLDGLWRLLHLNQSEYYIVTQPFSVGDRQYNPGEVILKGDVSSKELEKKIAAGSVQDRRTANRPLREGVETK